jgi:hypothetical protein
VGTEGKRLRILLVEQADDLLPEHPGGPHLGYLHEEVHAVVPEE